MEIIKELRKEKISLPEAWEVKTLGEVCEIFNGSTPLKRKKEFWEDGEINWFTINDIRKQGRNIKYTQQKITSEGFNSTSITLLPRKSVLLCCTASVGEYAITDVELTTNQQFNGLVVKEKNKLFSEYLFHYASTLKDKLLSKSGKATIDFVSMTKVKTIPIPLPPLGKQKQIVATLDKAFTAIDIAKANAEQNLQNAKELFESYLQNIFENKGDNWEIKIFDDVINFSQIGLVRNNKEQSSEYTYRYLKMNNINNDNGLNEDSFKFVNATSEEVKKYQLLNDDFLFNTRNSFELVGKNCLYKSDYTKPTLFNNNILRVRFNDFLFPEFAAYAFSSKAMIDSLEKIKSGTTNVVGIYYKSLKYLEIPIPPLPEQKQIVQKLDLLSLETKRLEVIYTQKIADLEEMKKSILQSAFSGQLNTQI